MTPPTIPRNVRSGALAIVSVIALSLVSAPAHAEPAGPTPRSGANSTITSCVVDESLSMRLCATIHYRYFGQDGYDDAVSVQKVTVRWSRIGKSSQTQVRSPIVRVAVHGNCVRNCSSSGEYFKPTVENFSLPTTGIVLGKTYSFTPAWAGKYVQTSNGGKYQCMSVGSEVYRRQQAWQLRVSGLCLGSIPGPII